MTLTALPPISFAIAARSGVVATTLICAAAVDDVKAIAAAEKNRVRFMFFIFDFGWLELVRGMRTEEKLELEPE